MKERLNSMKIGTFGVVTKVCGERKVCRRLYDMGITPGVEIYLRKKAPLGDPIEITIRGYELTLRKKEAENIEIEIERS